MGREGRKIAARYLSGCLLIACTCWIEVNGDYCWVRLFTGQFSQLLRSMVESVPGHQLTFVLGDVAHRGTGGGFKLFPKAIVHLEDEGSAQQRLNPR